MSTVLYRISIDGRNPRSQPPKSSAPSDPESPKGYYVYAHCDQDGGIFYIGKGTGRRAWSNDRQELWQRYVERHLAGKYQVVVVTDGLDEDGALILESEWMEYCGDSLVNWVNPYRSDDLERFATFNAQMDTCRELIGKSRALESSNPEAAVSGYLEAIEKIPVYGSPSPYGGLVGRLADEIAAEVGVAGQLEALDRLSLCLTRLGRATEADIRARRYFTSYRLDLEKPAAERIRRRIARSLARNTKRGKASSRNTSKVSGAPSALQIDFENSARKYCVDGEPRAGNEIWMAQLKESKLLKKEGRHEDLILLLIAMVGRTESEDLWGSLGVSPFPYEELAKIYRRLRRYADEVLILERYESGRKAPGQMRIVLASRLARARELLTERGAQITERSSPD